MLHTFKYSRFRFIIWNCGLIQWIHLQLPSGTAINSDSSFGLKATTGSGLPFDVSDIPLSGNGTGPGTGSGCDVGFGSDSNFRSSVVGLNVEATPSISKKYPSSEND